MLCPSSLMHPLTNAQVDTTRTTLSCAATNITMLYFFKILMCFLACTGSSGAAGSYKFHFQFCVAPSYWAMPIHILTASAKDSFYPTTLTKIVMFCLSVDSHSKQSQVVLKIIDIKCTHHTHKWQLWEVIYVNKLDGTILKCLISRNCVGCDKCIHLQMLT